MPTPTQRSRKILRSSLQARAAYARTNADLTVNYPDGFPSDFPPVWWIGSDQLQLNAHWSRGGWNYPYQPGWGTADALPAVIRATSLITGPLTAAPFREVDLSDGHPLGRARWITDPMLLRPDSRFATDLYATVVKLGRGAFWTEWLRSAIWWGAGAFICEEDETGQPLAGTLKNVNSSMLSTERDSQGVLHWVLGSDGADADKAVFDRDGYLTLGSVSYRIVVLRNPHSPVDSEGYSKGVFALAPGAFQMAAQIESYAHGQFRSGIPAGVLQSQMPNMTQEQADALKAAWMQAHGNDRRSVAVLNATTSFVPLNLSPVDAQLDATKRLAIGDVAFAFGLDPLTLGVSLGNSATYNNLRDAWVNHKDFGLAPWITAMQDVLTALLPGNQGIVISLDAFANPPLKERVETGAAATAAGLMTIDEWRASEGLPPMAEANA